MKNSLKIALVFLFFISCSKEPKYGYDNFGTEEEIIENFIEPTKEKNITEIVERKLIKKGTISFETDSLVKTRKHILKVTKTYKGYISEDSENKSYNKINTNITVRIPINKFDQFLAEVSSKVKNFDSKNITTSDVTEQFLDVQSRLKVKKKLEERYTQLLSKTKSVKEILEVERELSTVRSEVESIEGRLKYLQNQTSFSTLHIHFYKKEISKSPTRSFGNKLGNAFLNGVDNIKDFFLGLVNIWPFILLGIGAFIFVKRRLKKKK
ncbi:DUF4349 domain-containing protein [Tenacibaculum ovolyticum]|uniref:DUF4349 domain-containing protein n=1 Tax=Tenacibaculum ovolyticum TaxID=104270 RepID=UPI003BAB0553